MHGFAGEVFAQHRPHHRQAVTATGERGAPGTFERQIAAAFCAQFAEQERSAVAEHRNVVAELVSGVGLRDRGGVVGNGRADQQAEAFRAAQPLRVHA
ncbi:hypothetical protein C1Y40_05359 [Mycobacterium talmoniae]|uniref:Uncharacterized protein n=1 Tax=Mycobacterium talmoniae TaxID=1858794 RepID=A0A2S8BCW0_9MYCO|nr:hypothetical protein C1Y40_05359 [Mycobacterium talmoniae]